MSQERSQQGSHEGLQQAPADREGRWVKVLRLLPLVVFLGVWLATRDIVQATAALLLALPPQLAAEWFLLRRLTRESLGVGAITLVLGGLTVAVDDPIFVQWKPTIVFWAIAAGLAVCTLLRARNPLLRLFATAGIGPKAALFGQRLWALGFVGLGLLNLLVIYNYSEDAWVLFKFTILPASQMLVLVAGMLSAWWLQQRPQPAPEVEPEGA